MRVAFGTALFVLAALACADTTIDPEESILSGVQDISNQTAGGAYSGTNYGFVLNHSEQDPDFYLNEIDLTGGNSSFDPNANFTIAGPNLGNGFPSNDYTLGTAITGTRTFYWDAVIAHQGAFNLASAPVGTYNFDVLFKGGASSVDLSTVMDVPLTVEIINRLDVTENSVVDHSTIGQGQTATVTASLTNNMASRTFVTTTWFIGALSDNGGHSLAPDFLIGQADWFDKSIAPGATLSGLHSSHTAAADQPLGTYVGSTGIVGGLYNGDSFWFGDNGNTTVHVAAVPEPSSLLGLAGLCFFVRRRVKAKKA